MYRVTEDCADFSVQNWDYDIDALIALREAEESMKAAYLFPFIQLAVVIALYLAYLFCCSKKSEESSEKLKDSANHND